MFKDFKTSSKGNKPEFATTDRNTIHVIIYLCVTTVGLVNDPVRTDIFYVLKILKQCHGFKGNKPEPATTDRSCNSYLSLTTFGLVNDPLRKEPLIRFKALKTDLHTGA